MAVVFAEENEHGLIEDVDVTEGGLMGALALVVEYGDGQIPVFETALEQTLREVNVFAIHEEVFV